jgi:EAL domain-containing protein (putative c-di-GMP-specific phosphodiesterase class I)
MANAVAQRLLDRLSHPHRVQGEEIVVTASIGICFGSPAEHNPEALLRNCDSALSRARDGGGNHIEFFDEGVRQETSRRLKIDNLLRRAHEQGRLEVHYQPRVAAQTGSILGFEALLRLTDDELGVVSPAEFIPIAEQTGLIQSIGSSAMTQALEQLRCWSDAGFDRTTISINLSPHQFHDEIDRQIAARLEGLDPQRIELEVTESSLLRDEAAAIGALQRLRDRGFRIALDDFGTGYSSLSYMRRLPLDTVKIDSSFIGSMQRDRDAAAFTASIIAMVRTLRLGVVAEGVETPEQRDMLIEMGCDELQGALYSLAVPGDEALRMLAEADEKTR